MQRVLVSLSAPQSFQSSESWKQVNAALLAQLPLRNIHWKSASRTSIRTIQELDVTLVPLENQRDEHTSQIPVSILERPFLNIFVVNCEDVDVDTYRNTIKKQIKDWHSVVVTRKNQEWLILHVIKPDARATGGNFFQLKVSVFDKIKADFNIDKRERCVQVAWTSGHANPAAWAEFINKIKDGLVSAFDSAILQREEEVKRSESQKQMPGWNFCTFFILKESLATSFQGVNLFEDALIQYDELEAAFYQVLREKNLSWFGTFITPGPKDDSMPLLSISKKPYRDLILANTISVFDFRIYLLARQCGLLASMSRLTEIERKTSAFLGAFGRRLREDESTIPEFFVESWIYSSALSVVEQCDTWAGGLTLDGPNLGAFNAGKGELLELARNQLDLVGIKVGHLPQRPPFSMMIFPNSPDSNQERSSKDISNLELLSCIKDKDLFYDLYVAVTNRAIDMYAKAGRRKFALKLHGSLAALDLHRGHLETALTTYTSLPAHYAPHMWTSLESYMLSRALDTHADLDKSKDTEWIHILLSFMKTYVDSQGTELLMHEEDRIEYLSKLVAALKVAVDTLESDLTHPDHPAVSITVSDKARIAEVQDGCFLDVVVRNHLPCTLPVDEVCVTLAGREAEKFKFTCMTESIPPGQTSLTLFCPTSSLGTYALDSSEVRVSRLLLQWSHRKASGSGKPFKVHSTLVRIPRDLQALDIQLRQPDLIELGSPPALLVSVSSGRNHVSKAVLKLYAPSGVTFKRQNAKLVDEGSSEFQASTEYISLAGIGKDTTVSFSVPHSDASAFNAMKVTVEVDYVTASEPSITRTLRLSRVVVMSLPVSVNVEDFFRGKRLFSKFTISTTSHQHVRISSAQLEGPVEGLHGVRIVGCLPQKHGVVTVTPLQSANFLFHLDSEDGPVRELLSLRIRYRMLREEVESLIRQSVEDVLKDSNSLSSRRDFLVNRFVEALESDASWVDIYGITGELKVPGLSEEGELRDTIDRIKHSLQEHKHSYPPAGEWHEIKIPVDVPYMNIIAAARLKILPCSEKDTPLYAGQPISALLSIHTSFHWGSSANDKDRSYMMRFDIEEMIRDWLVSGRKRGDFAAKDDTTYTLPVTLIALHHGELALPKIAVTALPIAGEITMGSMAIPSTETYQVHGAQKVLVLPRGGRSTFVVGMGREYM